MVTEAPSPNHGDRRGLRPDMVVLHHTAMASAQAALARLCDPGPQVSAHWLIAEDGRVWRLVSEDRRAWHAGTGGWGDARDVNSRAIGVELANPGDAPFPHPQMTALRMVLGCALARWAIAPERVVGHACMAPGRKADPSARFDWRALALDGLSVWVDGAQGGGDAPADAFAAAARAFGYPLAPRTAWDAAALAVADAFRLRFRPWEATQAAGAPLSRSGLAQLAGLAGRWPVRRG